MKPKYKLGDTVYYKPKRKEYECEIIDIKVCSYFVAYLCVSKQFKAPIFLGEKEIYKKEKNENEK